MNSLKDIEKKILNGKIPDSDMSERHKYVWRKILLAQRARRKMTSSLIFSPWVWALGSVVIIFLFIVYLLIKYKAFN